MTINFANTPVLKVGYTSQGPPAGPPIILLHGWPDDVLTWKRVQAALADAGWRAIAPYLRGFGPTEFLSPGIKRSGQLTALARDLFDLADALGLERFAVAGHDWGARAAYIAAAIAPERVTHCISLSVGWGTSDPQQALPLNQARNYWYHWYMALDRGADLVRHDGKGLARFAWETWSPLGWFTETEFEDTARSFENPDWPEVVLHSYRHRWGLANGDQNYNELEAQLTPLPVIVVPTLVLHGREDTCNDPATSEGRESAFSGLYRRIVLDGVGHFPTREAPDLVARHMLSFLKQ